MTLDNIKIGAAIYNAVQKLAEKYQFDQFTTDNLIKFLDYAVEKSTREDSIIDRVNLARSCVADVASTFRQEAGDEPDDYGLYKEVAFVYIDTVRDVNTGAGWNELGVNYHKELKDGGGARFFYNGHVGWLDVYERGELAE